MYVSTVTESIVDILMTPLGSRVCLPEYGSRLYELVDRRVDSVFRADLTRFVFEAIHKWEKRVKPVKIKDVTHYGDKLSFVVELDDGSSVNI